MTLDPLKVTKAIKESYIRYLTTAFRLRDQRLQILFQQEVEKFEFTNGPLLEATPPFKNGCYFKELVKNGIIDKECERFLYHALPYLQNYPLYLHQEKSIRKIVNGRNIVIASGTGSGKTECFLLPIYNFLIREHVEKKLGPGIRALLLYPMNALVNDQLRRLREIARVMEKEVPEIRITFGRYVGETQETKEKGEEKFRLTNPGEDPVRSELLSREEMRENPPHILITNYAMLEYLLLRPDDSPFFDGKDAKHWKFLVLDEAHIYSGASGMEIGMLIRRLKDRVCEGRKGVLQCIATSATLVKDEKDFGKVTEFAKNLFDEKFEWVTEDESSQDIIKGERVEIIDAEGICEFPLQLYSNLDNAIIECNSPHSLLEQFCDICKEHGVSPKLIEEAKSASDEDAKRYLYNILRKDKRIIELKYFLENGPEKLSNCIKFVVKNHSPDKEQAIISLINLGVWARPNKETLPILPARYHLFVRAPEGVFVSLFPEPKIFLERHEKTDEGAAVFELASCRRCGQEYLVGDIVEGKLRHPFTEMDTPRKNRYFLLIKGETSSEENEDEEVAVPEEIAEKGKMWKLCVKCGSIDEKELKCNCIQKNKIQTLIEIVPKNGTLNKCYSCGLRSINIVREFIFQQDAPSAVLVTALFLNLEKKEAKDKKILVFSDSRQDAAFFAPYLDLSYKRILSRRIITEALIQNKFAGDYRLQTLCDDVLKIAKENNLFSSEMDDKQKKKEVWGWIIQEFCALDTRICLEGVGLLAFLAIPPRGWKPVEELSLPPWNLSEEEVRAVYQILINTFRYNKAITFPDDAPSPQDEIFARFNRNKEYKFRGEKSDSKNGIYAFIPASGRISTRIEFLKKLHKKITKQEITGDDCKKVLVKIWDDLKNTWVGKGIHQFSDSKHGVLFQIDYKYWQIVFENFNSQRFVCNRCGEISFLNVKGVCPTFNCNGSLTPLNSDSKNRDIENNHYRYLYNNLPLINLTAEEHTAQLKQDDASQVQQRFIRGEINVLSCSTTFELGVDLGELEVIFLRNVPPEPSNYIQRSGRAGRRVDSVGFTLTFAQLRSHDLTYFKEPKKMVEGRIKPPVVEIRNEKIIRRHLHSVVLARFFREYQDYYGTVDSFFKLESDEISGTKKLKEYLRDKPTSILESLKRTIPKNLHNTFDLENWGWTKDFVENDGALEIANAKIRDEYTRLNEFYQNKKNEWINTEDQKKRNRLNSDMGWASDRKETLKKKQLIDFLATHTIIPKYGFPVDVVELTLLSHIPVAKNIQLERDLRIAISEFAPSSQVVAKGYIWESAGLRVVKDRTWPIYWYAICSNCNRFYVQKATIDEDPPDILCNSCKIKIERCNIRRFITPIFGFVTSREIEPKKPSESRPKREFSTRPYFYNYK